MAWDYHIFEPFISEQATEAKSQDTQKRNVLLVAAKRTTIEPLLAICKELHMHVDVLQPDFLGMHNLLIHDYFCGSGELSPDGPVAVLDVGCDVTNLLVSSPSSLWFRTCGTGARDFTQALVNAFNLTTDQAEQLKHTPKTAKRLSELSQAFTPVLDDLLQEIQRSLSVYSAAYPKQPVKQLMGLGGGFCLHGLFRFLRCGR